MRMEEYKVYEIGDEDKNYYGENNYEELEEKIMEQE